MSQILPEPIRLVVFDWAGTTVDYGSFAPVAAFMQAFRASGIETLLPRSGTWRQDATNTKKGKLPWRCIRIVLA
jgi:phosphonoacetaldehyde hydrolase